jgi:PAS domain S-box-containing protein
MSTTSFLSALGHPGTLPSLGTGEFTYPFLPQHDVRPSGEQFIRPKEDRDMLVAKAERSVSELALSEERLRFTQKAGRIGSWTLHLAERRLEASEGCKGDFGRSPDQSFTYEAWIRAIHPDDRARMLAAIEASVAGQTDYDIEYRITTPQGAVRWIQSRGQASYRPDGTPLAIAGISLDITDRKQVEEHRDLLAKELSHRVKNTLAIIQSIVRQTLRRSTSLQEAEVALDARIQSLAAAHDVLTRDSWEGATLTEVVAVALRPFIDDQERRFEIGGPALRLGSRVALALAMALHELATNAVKYGALSNETGHVLLNWTMVDGNPPSRLRLRWQETGGPPVHPPTRTGVGSRMIERALATEIGGTAQIDYRPDGVVFTAEAPLPEVLGH